MARLTHMLDTEMVIEVIRGRSKTVRRKLDEHEGSIAVSSITTMELAYGALRSSDPRTNLIVMDELLDLVSLQAFDSAAAHEAARVRAELAAKGEPIGPYDVLLAGHARAQGLVLASGNVRDFRRVSGLKVENWRSRSAN